MPLGTLPARVQLGAHQVDTWRITATAGLVAGSGWFLVLASATGGALALALALPPLLLLGFVGFSLARRRLTGRETTVLLEHLAVALVLATAALALAGQDVVRWLDRLIPSLAVLFAFGRVGCAAAGCCHGVRWSVGSTPGRPARFPTQLLEASAWAALAIGGSATAAIGPPGAAASGVLAGYAVVRFALEGVRGDSRPHWLGWSESRWLSASALVTALGLAPVGVHTPEALGLVGAGALAALALVATRRRWLIPAPARPLEPLVAFGRGLRDDPPPDGDLRTLALDGWSLAASSMPDGPLLVSIAGVDRPIDPADAALALASVAEGANLPTPPVEQLRPGMFAASLRPLLAQPGRAPAAPPPSAPDPRPEDYFSRGA